MSYFLFGAITIEPSQEKDGDLVWRIADAAASSRLYLLLGPNVHQKVVLDMLRSQGLVDEGHLPLLLTWSAICNTSEELLADYEATEGELRSTRKNLNRVSEWLQAVLKIPGVLGIHLLASDGFNDEFAELQIPADQLADVVMARIKEEGDVPSLSIRVVPSATMR